MDDSRVKSARELLSAFFDEEKLKRGGLYVDFFASWKFLVGDQLAAHSHIAEIEKGVLIIEAEHPGWIQLLQLRQTTILEGISQRFPELGLRSIAFRLGSPRPDPRATEKVPSKWGRNIKAVEEETEKSRAGELKENSGISPHLVEDIADPALRTLLKSLGKTLQGEP